MTNPDNVGGLLSRVREALVSCTEYRVGSPAYEQIVAAIDRAELCRAPGDAGGLPELPTPRGYLHIFNQGPSYGSVQQVNGYTADQMRAYGELCRAAPSGGDPTPLEEMAGNARDLGLNYGPRSCPFCGYSMTEFPGLDSEHIGQWIFQNEREEFGLICGACEAEGPAASTKAGAIQTWNERHDATVFGHSAPAGSGEVEKLVKRLEAAAGAYPEDVFPPPSAAEHALHGHVIQSAAAGMGRHMAPMLLEAAALLRKLQQGAE